ncbi:chalcone-flavanone isomerase-domain-containing protein [Cokeromyces recurvatus]|uniref:chalcone-flavanone isomerase-domain-containing protein n=1 Tax=Cokeromyces recurvatus TaxID=90255 RepID=UPI00221F9F20|nr:chalcone-flavanone isomerase-domain-containing protein [Cokeromyces recurvatus]KAI7899264.1 chalcone-flavanone isomerase-domain-containing protein [Cokeromyces recurvatus]
MFRLSRALTTRLPKNNSSFAHVTRRILPTRCLTTTAYKATTSNIKNAFVLTGCVAATGTYLIYSQQQQIVYAEAPLAATDTVADPSTNIAFPLYINSLEEGLKMLIGLGIRRVSFLNMGVYVLGLYMKTEDIDKLRKLSEWKDFDKSKLLSDKKLAEQLLDEPYEISIRLVPVRNTNTQHLRDSFIRALMQRMNSQQLSEEEERQILEAIQEFKANFIPMRIMKETAFIFTKTVDGGFKMEYEGRDLGTIKNPWLAKNFIIKYLNPDSPSSPAALNDIAEGFERLMKN